MVDVSVTVSGSFKHLKINTYKTNIFDVWMEVLVCIWINFSKHLKKENEREKGWGPPN
jgi:hypothetical protein